MAQTCFESPLEKKGDGCGIAIAPDCLTRTLSIDGQLAKLCKTRNALDNRYQLQMLMREPYATMVIIWCRISRDLFKQDVEELSSWRPSFAKLGFLLGGPRQAQIQKGLHIILMQVCSLNMIKRYEMKKNDICVDVFDLNKHQIG